MLKSKTQIGFDFKTPSGEVEGDAEVSGLGEELSSRGIRLTALVEDSHHSVVRLHNRTVAAIEVTVTILAAAAAVLHVENGFIVGAGANLGGYALGSEHVHINLLSIWHKKRAPKLMGAHSGLLVSVLRYA